ncbi:MAG: sigma-70 family RNA polymerase sigma factor [Verrucomicrobia bacterium]|nr:sigma-70 family RNA polymerase sigma factor [Verrucomicrobiota bacterium]
MSPSEPEQDSGKTGGNWFATTHWSVVLAAGDRTAPYSSEALEKLCRAYWYPLYAYVRRRGYEPHDAQDLTQEFFARLLERNYLGRADRERGKFRSFLLAALNYFLADEWDKAKAQKRGGTHTVLSLDDNEVEKRYRLEPASGLTPEKIFERRWALTLLDQALDRLRKEMAAAGKAQQFQLLKIFLASETAPGDYESVGSQMNMNAGQVAMMVHRLRQKYRAHLRSGRSSTTC